MRTTQNIHFNLKLNVDQIRHLEGALSEHLQTYEVESKEDVEEYRNMEELLKDVIRPLCLYGLDLEKVKVDNNSLISIS